MKILFIEWTLKTLCLVNKPDTEGQISYDPTYMRHLEYTIHKERKYSAGDHGLGSDGNGELFFNWCGVYVGDDEKG